MGYHVRKMDHLSCFAPGMLALGAKTSAVSSARATAQMVRTSKCAHTHMYMHMYVSMYMCMWGLTQVHVAT